MSLVGWLKAQNVKDFFWSSLCLATALVLALLSALARRDGFLHAAAFLATVSLILAVVVCLTLVPKLLQRVKTDYLERFRFFRFTRRGGFFILIVLVIGFSSFNTGNNLLILVLSFLLASLIVSGLVSNLVLHGLKISLNVPEEIHAGQTAVFFLTLHNMKKLVPSFALRLKGNRRGAEGQGRTDFFLQEKKFPYVRAAASLRLNLNCRFEQRGIYRLDGFQVTTTFPFGFISRGRKLEANGSIVIYPELVDLGPLFARYPFLTGYREKNRKGLGAALYNVRGYCSGDEARYVHWKATAKLQRLMVKDFARDEENPLNLIFSTYLPDCSRPSLAQFEKGVSYVATLVKHYEALGRHFGFYSGEYEVRINGRRENFESVMEYLAQVRPSPQPLIKGCRFTSPSVLFSAGESVSLEGVHRVNYLAI